MLTGKSSLSCTFLSFEMLSVCIFRELYSEILRTEWVRVFNQIFDEDNYTAITVETAEEYRRITDVYPFRDISLEKVIQA